MIGHAVAAARACCPGFEPAGDPRRTLKCAILPGTLGCEEVVAKVLVRFDPLWQWYFERETAIYSAFLRETPPVRVPRLYHADAERGVLVIERIPGAPVAAERRARRPLPAALVRALLDARARLAAWGRGLDLVPQTPPTPSVVSAMRVRLLEDPTAPFGWFVDGFARAAALELIPLDVAVRMERAMRRRPAVAFAHGDLLLRNALRVGDHSVALVDWECAGAHPEAWDLALLWVGLDPADRAPVEAAAREGPAEVWPAFLAAVAFGLARELKFCTRAARAVPEGRAASRIRAELGAIQRALRALPELDG